jgi:alkylhydroperoxidase family enzyme
MKLRIDTAREEDAPPAVRDLLAEARLLSPRDVVPPVVRLMGWHPDALAGFLRLRAMLYGDGALTARQHNMIYTYASSLNNCRF